MALRNGAVIDDPLGHVHRFIETDGTYLGYDARPTSANDVSELDIRLANRMIARMGKQPADAVLSRRPQLRAALAELPTDATLTAPVDRVPWTALGRLFAAVDGLPGVG